MSTAAEPLDLNFPQNVLGEGIHWERATGRLFWVDIEKQCFYIRGNSDGQLKTVETRLPVSFVFPTSADEVLAGLADGLYLVDMRTGQERLVAPLSLPENHRLNDGKCDPLGRLWVGTMNTAQDPAETAALYLLQGDGFAEIEGGYANAYG